MNKKLVGEIIALKSSKTATIKITKNRLHPKFNKLLRMVSKKQVHYEEKHKELIEIGKKVEIKSCKPISKNKKFVIDKVL